MKLRSGLVAAHRWVSLVVAAFWLTQAATGVVAVFHWEIDDATIAGEPRELNLDAIETRAAELASPVSGLRVDSIWSSAGAPNRFDIFLEPVATGTGRVIRVDGAGRILRTRLDGERFRHGGLLDTLVLLHQSLLGGDRGRWIVGASGLLLLSNLGLGAFVAWPRRGLWRRALRPLWGKAGPTRLYAWHRALGLWAGLPAAGLVAAGVFLAFENATGRWIQPSPVDPPALSMPAGAAPPLGMAEAGRIAMARYPGAVLSGIDFPSADSAWWSVRLRQPGELRRAYGKTRIFVSAIDGAVGADFDALAAPVGRRFVDSLFSLHTGELAGTPGRLVALAIGAWLLAMCFLGIRLWWVRR